MLPMMKYDFEPALHCKLLLSLIHGNVARMGDTEDTYRALHTSVRGLPKDCNRRSDRPRHSWLRTLEIYIQPLNHGLNSALRHAKD